jgi:preprotein translocase subunit YajC
MIESGLITLFFQAGNQPSSPLGLLGFMLPLLAILYLLMILPQQRRQKRWQQMIGELKSGDRITTQGGIRGVIIALKDDSVHLRVPPDNLRLEVTKSAILSVIRDEEPKKAEK